MNTYFDQNDSKEYIGIDVFRVISALLVVAIHTSPLAAYSETGDFILTRVIARTAVPFFMMTSGFFLISRYQRDTKKLKRFLKSTASVYGAAILFYLPINVYNGYFQTDLLLPKLIQDLVFDGTLYHLWYLPAVMIGAWIAWHAVKAFGYSGALSVTGVLYVLGLLGDSYYGIAVKLPVMAGFYELVFQISDYTRNGIFMAPLFLVMGGLIADKQRRLPLKTSLWGFGATLVLMRSEALLLHRFGLQRHDSMYLFLPLCMFFAFLAILHISGKRSIRLRTASLIIYVIHPMVIVGVRLSAKLFCMEKVLIENSVMHFISVALLSAFFGFAGTYLLERYQKSRKKGQTKSRRETDRAWIELDLKNLTHNVKTLQTMMPQESRLMAVVKTQAYGHGAFEIAVQLNKMGIRAYAVATVDEGIALRNQGILGEILILGHTAVWRARELKKYRLTQTVIDFAYAAALNRQGITVHAHLKIDTGMHRFGIPDGEADKLKKVFVMKNLKIDGIYTHLCCADHQTPEDEAFTREQIRRFYEAVGRLKADGISIPKLHIQSSYGLLNYPELSCDYVRVGIALYGGLSAPDRTLLCADLRPVLSLRTQVVLIRKVCAGETIGYGRSYTAERDMRVAILPVGYGDGYPRNLSDGGCVLINRHCAPIVGRICMDSLAVDITDLHNVAKGDTATLIGAGTCGELPASVTAVKAGTISNELLCRLGARLPVVIR